MSNSQQLKKTNLKARMFTMERAGFLLCILALTNACKKNV